MLGAAVGEGSLTPKIEVVLVMRISDDFSLVIAGQAEDIECFFGGVGSCAAAARNYLL